MTKEEWLPVPGYEELYEVSSLGSVRNSKTQHVMRGCVQRYKGGSLRRSVTLSKGGKSRTVKVHRLVALAFVPNPDNKREVNHINGDPLNNAAANLEWCTGSENMLHAYKNGLAVMSKSRREKIAKANMKPVRRSDGAEFESVTAAAIATHCSVGEVSAVLSGKRSSSHGFSFEWEEVKDE